MIDKRWKTIRRQYHERVVLLFTVSQIVCPKQAPSPVPTADELSPPITCTPSTTVSTPLQSRRRRSPLPDLHTAGSFTNSSINMWCDRYCDWIPENFDFIPLAKPIIVWSLLKFSYFYVLCSISLLHALFRLCGMLQVDIFCLSVFKVITLISILHVFTLMSYTCGTRNPKSYES